MSGRSNRTTTHLLVVSGPSGPGTAGAKYWAAVNILQRFVRVRAAHLAREKGFGYRATADAPFTFPDLQAAHKLSRLTGVPLPISSLYNDRTIWGPATNIGFRFWHDCTHLRLNAGFETEPEIEVGTEQLKELETVKIEPDSLPWRLLYAETIGQTRCIERLGAFPIDQRLFSADFCRGGLNPAIEREKQRRELQLADAKVIKLRGPARPFASTDGSVSLLSRSAA